MRGAAAKAPNFQSPRLARGLFPARVPLCYAYRLLNQELARQYDVDQLICLVDTTAEVSPKLVPVSCKCCAVLAETTEERCGST